jgi:hypothetical protein
MLQFELKLFPNKNNSLFGSCTCNDILGSSPFLLGYNLSKTEQKLEELNLYYDSSLHKQIAKQYILSKCYKQDNINSKL